MSDESEGSSEVEETDEEAANEEESSNGFARHDEPTAQMPDLKRMGLLKGDKKLHQSRQADEEE